MINLCCNKLKVQNVYEVHRLEHGYGDLSIGTELFGRIIDNNAYDCKILFNYAMGNNSGTDPENNYAYMWYDDNNVAHSNEGCGAVIQLGYDTPSPWVESGEYMEQEKMPLYIAIGHEMIHALRIMGGNFKDPDYYYDYSNQTAYEEYETSGISYYDSNGNFVDCGQWHISENALRREHRYRGEPGCRRRVRYNL